MLVTLHCVHPTQDCNSSSEPSRPPDVLSHTGYRRSNMQLQLKAVLFLKNIAVVQFFWVGTDNLEKKEKKASIDLFFFRIFYVFL